MEVEETTLPMVENSDESNAKKGKIMTLMFSPDATSTEGKETKKDKNKPPSKVVIRRLPPRLVKEALLEELAPLPAHDYFHFVRGDLSLGNNSFSRAYINFINHNDIYEFKEKYDDYGIQDEKGKTYHAVVEFAPFQRVPRRNNMKKKLSKAGTLESDPKYIEFLKKLEEYKNNASNTSEYFHETESPSLKTKITTTPLLEFLKQKKQKKNDLKNEIRPRKRELEKERKRKEEEKRKMERERRKEDKKNSRYDDKNKMLDEKARKSEDRLKENRKNEIRGRSKEDKKDLKNWKGAETESSLAEDKPEIIVPSDPAILKVVIRQPEKPIDKNGKITGKVLSAANEETKSVKNVDSDFNLIKNEKKYSDFRTRLAEEKQRKTFHKKDSDDSKTFKTNSRSRKGVPDEKGDNYSIGNCSEARDYGKKSDADMDLTKKHESKMGQKEAKSKFRYSEQRNREREYRSQKTSDWKRDSLSINSKVKCKVEAGEKDDEKENESSKSSCNADEQQNACSKEENEAGNETQDEQPAKSRRRSLEMEKTQAMEFRKRSRSFHDISNKSVEELRLDFKVSKSDAAKDRNANNGDGENPQMDECSRENNESEKVEDERKKDPRAERRIRNKDRPSIEIYRPGMGKFSKQRIEQKKEETNSNPQGCANLTKNIRMVSKTSKKPPLRNDSVEYKPPVKSEKSEDSQGKNSCKSLNELRTMTFTRSGSKEN